jgi:hypothetical protein
MSESIAKSYLEASVIMLKRDMGKMTPERFLSLTTKLKDDMIELMREESATKEGEKMGLSINKLKDRNGVSSEILLGIKEPPEHLCNRIDSILKDVVRGRKEITAILDYLIKLNIESENIEEVIDEIKIHTDDIDTVLSCVLDVSDEIDELRYEIEDLREWGQQWKDLAKSLSSGADIIDHVTIDLD